MEEIQETDSQLSMTYVPSENQSLAQLIPDEAPGITVEIKPEVSFENVLSSDSVTVIE